MTVDEMRAAVEKMAAEHEGTYSDLRKPTSTEVRQSKAQFAIHPQWGIASFSLGCLYCNTGCELDYYGSKMPESMLAFFGRHKTCTPGCLPPEARIKEAM